MAVTTVGKFLINEQLPDQLKNQFGELNKRGIGKFYQRIAQEFPERYRDISLAFQRLGGTAAYQSGGYSVGVSDLVKVPHEAQAVRARLKNAVKQVIADPTLSPEQKNDELVKVTKSFNEELENTLYKSALAAKHPVAMQIATGSKGQPTNLKSLLVGDGLYTDANYREIPYPVLKSYSEGISPAEYLASSFGARTGVVTLKLGTADGGYAAKRLNNVAHRLVVTGVDSDKEHLYPRGVEGKVNDDNTEGKLLAHDVGGFKRNTILTPKVLSDLHRQGIDSVLLRSPAVGGPADGGVYSRDLGVRELGSTLYPVGVSAGLVSASSLCLAEGTEVKMADGTVKNIEDVKVGDTVLGSNRLGVIAPVKVLDWFDNGLKEVYETSFRRSHFAKDSIKLRSTLNHRILAKTKRLHRDADRFAFSDNSVIEIGWEDDRTRVAAAPVDSYDDRGHVHEPFALALGLLIGDGCYTGNITNNGVMLSCYDPAQIEDIQPYFNSLGCRVTPQTTNGEWRISDNNGGKSVKGQPRGTIRNPMRRKLVDLGMWGQYSHEKTIPSAVYLWDNESVFSLLAGLWATDGTVSQDVTGKLVLSYGCTSNVLIEQIRDLLWVRLGIYTCDTSCDLKEKPDFKYGESPVYRPMYKFTVGAAGGNFRKFAEAIKIPGAKKLRLAKLLENRTDDQESHVVRTTSTLVGLRRTYDIHVDNEDNLYLLANGLIVHNSEPMTQSLISSKHQGGVAGASTKQQGFPTLDRLISIPENFPGAAVHARVDGKVDSVTPAPQGGWFVKVGDETHYADPDSTVTVKPGQEIESGDPLTDGIVRPDEIVHHKGIGEGRVQFVKAFKDAAENAGFRPSTGNLELIARGLIDHVELHKEVGDHVPGDILSYNTVEHAYEPRPGHIVDRPKKLYNHYLEAPVLHYTIGTRITPSVAKNLEKWNIEKVHAHKEPPPFSPVMIRSQETMNYDPDWMTRFLGTGLEKSFLKGVHRGDVSDPLGTSYVPAVASGIGVGERGLTKGYDAKAFQASKNILPKQS